MGVIQNEDGFSEARNPENLLVINSLPYQFGGGAAWAVSQYNVTSANDAPERDPQDWAFQASNDGTNWTTLDTRNGEKFKS